MIFSIKFFYCRCTLKIKKNKTPAEPPREFELDEFCSKPKYPRFIAYLSVDAQFAMVKAYDDTLRAELYSIYPQIEVIPRTSSARFMPDFKPKQFDINEDDKLKISHFIQSAMIILDIILEFKRRRNFDAYINDDSEEKSPLCMYIQWIKLWNREFL